MENFGIRLAECRRNKNFTQEELANRLGVTPQALSKWEKGLSSPENFWVQLEKLKVN